MLLSGSGVHFYGDRGDEEVDERSSDGTGFLAEVCREWEASTAPAEAAGVRVVYLRSGIVLAPSGGALAKMLPLFKLGLGGRFGSGRQWMSWISLTTTWAPSFTCWPPTSPVPSTWSDLGQCGTPTFADTLGEVLATAHRAPGAGVRAQAAARAERADAMLFDSIRVRPRVLERSGFAFAHPDLGSALRAQLGR